MSLRLVERIPGFVTGPRAALRLALLGVALSLPALWGGIGGDDWAQRARLLGLDPAARVPSPLPAVLDLFRFYPSDPGLRRSMDELGLLPWWAHPELRVAFLRPVAAATHWLDYRLWPDAFWLQHLHSLLWLGLGLWLAARLYRRSAGVGLAAGLAGLFFALEDAHAMPAAWLANRNALVGLALGEAALLLHLRARQEHRPLLLLPSALLLGLGLLSAEATVGALAYLLAWSLLADTGPWRARLGSLLPAAAVTGAWRLLYRAWGYGAHGSGLYIDPGAEPLAALRALLERGPLLLLAQWFQLSTDPWLFLPRWAQLAFSAAGWAFLPLLAALLLPLLRERREARAWGLGMLLAAVPASMAFPMDRQLLWLGLGAFGLLGLQVERMGWFQGRPPPAGPAARKLTWTFLLLHGFLTPLWTPVRVAGVKGVFRAFDRVSEQAPADAAVPEQTFVFVNGSDLLGSYLFLLRAMHGQPVPRRLALLAPMLEAVELERPDERSLLLRPEGGLLASLGDRLARSLDPPFRPGERVERPDYEVEVLSVTGDGRPAELRFTFREPLESPHYRWLRWREGELGELELPPVGGRLRLPATMPRWR